MRETTWTLRGLPFAAVEWGEPTGVPTLLLHGFLDHAGSWSRVAAHLPGWRVALDLRGHGRSPHAGDGDSYHFAEYLADVDALVERLGAVKLVGHSMGGTIATLYAGVRPERVACVVAVDGIGLHDSGDAAVDRMAQFLDGERRRPRHKVFADVAVAAGRLRVAFPSVDEAWSLELAARATRPVEGGVTWSWDPRHRIRSPYAYRHDNHAQFLRAIRCPVLSVHPERSPFVAADVVALEGEIARLSVVSVPHAGHMIHLDAPVPLAHAIRGFLEAVEAPPAP